MSTVSLCSNASVMRRVLAACVSLLWQDLLIAGTLTGTVIKITDGDTLTVLDSTFSSTRSTLPALMRLRANSHSALYPD
ncbi:MAG TPA: hypothetical protein VKB96_07005 [Gammaproteobacteria bacterium]|nr:hypothetical protein [Gammaproteobacteria bacterium]